MENIVLISLAEDKLKDLIREAVHDEFTLKKEKEVLNFKETCLFLGISASPLNKWKVKIKSHTRKWGSVYFLTVRNCWGR